MHERTRHRQALPPSTGKLRCAPADVRLQMSDRDQFIAALGQCPPAQTVELARENKVLIHRQLVVERKFLGHITDHVLNRFCVLHYVMSADSRRALTRLEDSAQHPDHSRFAGTIWPEKAEDRPFSDGERNMIDGRERAETFR